MLNDFIVGVSSFIIVPRRGVRRWEWILCLSVHVVSLMTWKTSEIQTLFFWCVAACTCGKVFFKNCASTSKYKMAAAIHVRSFCEHRILNN